MLTRRNVLGLMPGAAAIALVSPITTARVPTPADYAAAWQALTEALWAPRIDGSSAWLVYSPYNEWGSAACSGTRFLWENPDHCDHPTTAAERDRIGALIATGKFWPLGT